MLRRFLRLPPTRRRALLTSAAVVAFVRLLLWLLPSASLWRLLRRTALGGPDRARAWQPVAKAPLHSNGATRGFTTGCWSPARRDALSDEIAWSVTTAARYIPRATCLTQALAAQWLHTRAGCATRLRLGVTRGADGVFRAHAWLERDGRVVVGGEERGAYAAFPPLPVGGAEG